MGWERRREDACLAWLSLFSTSRLPFLFPRRAIVITTAAARTSDEWYSLVREVWTVSFTGREKGGRGGRGESASFEDKPGALLFNDSVGSFRRY
jgi:hypothetical protein